MGAWKDFLIELAKKLTPNFAFAIVLVVILALLGGRIPPVFHALVYIVAIAVIVIPAVPEFMKELGKKPDHPIEPPKQPPIPEKGEVKPVLVSSVTQEDARREYLEAVIANCRAMRLVGLDPRASDPSRGGLSLEKLYVSLDTTKQVEVEKEARQKTEKSGSPIETSLRGVTRSLSALEALVQSKERRMVLLGLPGTGKSTYVRYLSLRMAQGEYDKSLDINDLLPGWKGGALLPVMVSLGRLSESITPSARYGESEMIERYLVEALEADPRTAEYAPHLLASLMHTGGLVLFDGLDEVANLELRPVIVQAVEAFVNRFSSNRASRFLITCRTYSYYHDERWQMTGWPTYELALLDDDKIMQFVDAWHTEHSLIEPARQADYERKRIKLREALHPDDRRRLSEIAPFPIILTMMAVVHTHYGELPDTRAQVYEKCTDLLLVRWEAERPVVSGQLEKRTILDALGVLKGTLDSALWEIAFKAHEGWAQAAEDRHAPALVTEDLLSGVLQVHLQDPQKVKTFLDYCQSANGLLMLQGTMVSPDAPPNAPVRRVYAFPHLTFEEYLAGRHLEGPDLGRRVRALLDRSDRWMEVIKLLGEYLCFERRDYERMDSILAALAPDISAKEMRMSDWRAMWLAGDLLTLYRRNFRNPSSYDERIVTGLSSLVAEGALSHRERAAAADTLDELGWLPDDLYHFVPIPGGDAIAAFYLSKYPVTNHQYQHFVDAEDFADPELWQDFPKFDEKSHPMKGSWSDEGWRWLQGNWDEEHKMYPRDWHDPRFGIARKGVPVVGITWYEANAFCRWLLRHWAGPDLPYQRANPELRFKELRLPTEAEWELAAGGAQPEGRYAWDEPGKATTEVGEITRRANVSDGGIGRTTPVGMHPLGVSQPFGLWDMAGNVWEWQANYYRKDHDVMALRGGSWNSRHSVARVAYRLNSPPHTLWYLYGFRVLALPS